MREIRWHSCSPLVHTDLNSRSQTVYLIDRKNDYYELEGLFFPHHENPQLPLQNTIVDGELVFDVDPRTTMKLCGFWLSIVSSSMVKNNVAAVGQALREAERLFLQTICKNEERSRSRNEDHPFDIRVKEIRFSYHAEQVFADMVNLQHGSDGLIYTCVNAPYTPPQTRTC
ncbi:mRNA capping enzyme [Mycena leptocephala]|nr:mRNA capping enzyme [Mycena leptocephala]